MEERGVVEGRSWQSLKEGSKRSIVKRLDFFGFGLDEQQDEERRRNLVQQMHEIF